MALRARLTNSSSLCPSWRFSASAVSVGMLSSAEMASVSSRPPLPSTRTNRGIPPSCTAIAVTPPPKDTIPSALGLSSLAAGGVSARISASGNRSTAATARPADSTHDDEARRRRLVRGDEQHLHHGFAVVVRALPEDGEVEHGLVERDRDEVAGLELERARRGRRDSWPASRPGARRHAGSRGPAGPAPS